MNAGGNNYSTSMGCLAAKVILSSSGVSFYVQSRDEKCTLFNEYSGTNI